MSKLKTVRSAFRHLPSTKHIVLAVFLTKSQTVRLGDFGIGTNGLPGVCLMSSDFVARVLTGTNEMAMSVVGTPLYVALVLFLLHFTSLCSLLTGNVLQFDEPRSLREQAVRQVQ